MGEYLYIIMFASALFLLLRGYPVALTLAGVGLLFALIGAALKVGYFSGGDINFLRAFGDRIFGLFDTGEETLLAVPMFIFMGVMLERSQIAGELLETMGRTFGSTPGGLALSVSFVGMLLAASTGIVGATVVTMGLISLPTMLKYNYSKPLACGSIAAAGTLGQIIPPSIVLVILGDQISNAYVEARNERNSELQSAAWAEGDFSFSPPPVEPVSVGDLFVGAMLPGLLLVVLYMLYQVFIAYTRPQMVPAMKDTARPGWGEIFNVLIPPILLILAVLGSIVMGIAAPTEAAGLGAVGALLLAGARADREKSRPMKLALLAIIALFVLKQAFDLRVTSDETSAADRLGIYAALAACATIAWAVIVSIIRVFRSGVLYEVMSQTTRVTSMVFMILIGAQLFNLTFRGLGGEEAVHHLLHAIPGGVYGQLGVIMLVMFVLGFFLDFLEIVFVVIPIVAPALFIIDGVDPVWIAILIAINLQTSFLTPPFGFALFYLRGVAPPEVTTIDIYKGVIPFVMIQIIALIILVIWPELATWLPDQVLG